MKNNKLMFCLLIALIFSLSSIAFSQDTESIKLPEPQTDIGKPLMQVLKLRHSTREYNSKMLPYQEISNLLWAAWGINREESGRRTAPSMGNRQTIDIYVAKSGGLYLYNAQENALEIITDAECYPGIVTEKNLKIGDNVILHRDKIHMILNQEEFEKASEYFKGSEI